MHYMIDGELTWFSGIPKYAGEYYVVLAGMERPARVTIVMEGDCLRVGSASGPPLSKCTKLVLAYASVPIPNFASARILEYLEIKPQYENLAR